MTAVAPARAATAPSGGPEASAPQTGRGRRAGAWVAIAVVLVVVGLLGAALSGLGRWQQRVTLDPESAAPAGGRALARLLDAHGVHVEVVRDRAGALAALHDGDATLVLPDSPFLSDADFRELAGAATDLVVAEPRSRGLRLLFTGSRVVGYGDDGPVDPSCDLAEAGRAGAIVVGAAYSLGDGSVGCYPSQGGFGLLQIASGDDRITVVDGTALFTNEHLAQNGNAALGVNLMGRLPTLVWYVPTLADSDAGGDATIGELTPPWVSPAIVLLLVSGVAAGVWRGRRFGPLVSETLPVTVRAAETTQGRARLYARSRDALHAADRLRIGALTRLARMLALGPAAAAGEIADAAADRVGAPRGEIRGILIDTVPASDRELVALSDRLRDLEAAVHAAVRSTGTAPGEPGRNRP